MQSNTQQIVKLNVGGKRFETLRSTLLSIEGTYFTGLLKDCENLNNEEIFIDRDGEKFGPILSYLRGDRNVFIDPMEASFYALPLPSMPFFEKVQKDIFLVREYLKKFQNVFLQEIEQEYCSKQQHNYFRDANPTSVNIAIPHALNSYQDTRPLYVREYESLLKSINKMIFEKEAKCFWRVLGLDFSVYEPPSMNQRERYFCFSYDVLWSGSYDELIAPVDKVYQLLNKCVDHQYKRFAVYAQNY